ncbi:methyltransferase domain-containing protein [Kineococcus rhizosphaerae]|uniref:Methyltransferase family protein n=1 Tax=Kineococcus rhizosphaerae TaxID=559628 RepID=A0A2T0R8L3_9ACTN|nr:methyltransferase domain-containing protein [Kineococcus rhizosphaerae]PRY17523.1 methyltransferase family protein [Kineococcus rhizosphaerae]
MAKERGRPRTSTVLWDGVQRLLADAAADSGASELTVVDLGGGTGGLAVRVAALGHRVVVVDPSPDALAALERRTVEAGLSGRVRSVQGDAAELSGLLAAGSVDVLLCHGVLEVVDDPAAALRAAHDVLRPGGRLSLLVAQWPASVLSRVLAGHLGQALHVLSGDEHRWSPNDPLRRRYDRARATALAEQAGFTVTAVEGARTFSDVVPSASAESDDDLALLHELELLAAASPELQVLAGQLHLHATR